MDWYSEEILRIAFDDSGDLILDGERTIAGHHVVQRARLKIDTVRWVMAKLHPGRYGDRPAIEADDSKQITFSWIKSDPVVEPAPAPPKQITYQRPELPGDLSEADWQKLLQILEVAKRVAPSDSVPDEVLEVIRSALLAHYKDEPTPKPIVLKPRGKSGKRHACD
jgi:hypothetical protein